VAVDAVSGLFRALPGCPAGVYLGVFPQVRPGRGSVGASLPATGGATGWGWLPLVLLLAAGLGYAVACAVRPYRRCRWCGGTGKRRSVSGRSFRVCRWCSASGRRLRLGRRAFNYGQRVRSRG